MGNESLADCLNKNFTNASYLCQTNITKIVLPAAYTIIFLFGVPGNILSLWIFGTKILDKTATHIYLINLGVSNIVFCLTMPLMSSYYAMASWMDKTHPVCKLAVSCLTPIIHVNITLGMINLTWVAMCRCGTLIQNIHVDQPSRFTYVLPLGFLRLVSQIRVAWVISLGSWSLALGATLPAIVQYSLAVSQIEVREKCYSIAVEANIRDSNMGTVIIGSLVIFFVCYLVILVAYMALLRHIDHVRKSTGISNSHRIFSRVLRNIMAILGVLTICLMPHHVFKVIFLNMAKEYSTRQGQTDFCHPLSAPVEVKNMLLSLTALRCGADPITYFLLDGTFRKHTIDLFQSNNAATTRPSLPGSSHPSKVHVISQGPTDNSIRPDKIDRESDTAF